MTAATTSHAQAAAEWMAAHPEAMELFRSMAQRCVEKRRRIGIGALTERVRWELHVERHTDQEWKINNNHRAYIARELIRTVPGFVDLIETRSAEGDGPCAN